MTRLLYIAVAYVVIISAADAFLDRLGTWWASRPRGDRHHDHPRNHQRPDLHLIEGEGQRRLGRPPHPQRPRALP